MRRMLLSAVVVWVVLLSATPLLLGQDAAPSGDSGQSLGAIARKVRPKDAKVTTKRVFTDDDVAHGTDSGSATTTHSDFKSTLEDAQKVIDTEASLNSRQLGNLVVGDIRFPGRDEWEERLYQQRQKLLGAAQMMVDWAASKTANAKTQGQAAGAERGMGQLVRSFHLEQYKYDQISAEGVSKATAWEKRSR